MELRLNLVEKFNRQDNSVGILLLILKHLDLFLEKPRIITRSNSPPNLPCSVSPLSFLSGYHSRANAIEQDGILKRRQYQMILPPLLIAIQTTHLCTS